MVAADRIACDVLGLLQDLARHVERQVVRVDDAADEAQVGRHQLLGVVHDEHPAHVELDAAAVLAIPQVERRPRRQVEEHRELLPSLHLGVRVGERRVDVVGHVLVQLVVLLLGDLALGPGPERRRAVDLLVFVGDHLGFRLAVPPLLLHQDGNGDVVGVLAQDLPQAMARQQIVLVGPQVQDDVGPAGGLLDGFDRVAAFSRALPADAVLGGQAGAPRDQGHPVGDDEGGVEADAELSDEVRVLGPVGGQLGEELARPRLGDGADVVDDVLPGHADAVVGHRDRPRRRVVADPDAGLRVVFEERGVGHRLEPQLVGGIRGVRDELAQEDLLVAVQGVNHQVQELRDLGLESEGFLGRRIWHGCLSGLGRRPSNSL